MHFVLAFHQPTRFESGLVIIGIVCRPGVVDEELRSFRGDDRLERSGSFVKVEESHQVGGGATVCK